MTAPNKQMPTLPPLMCEQLEDRQVLTVHVGPTAVIATNIVHAHLGPTIAANSVMVQGGIALPAAAAGANQQGAQQGGSSTAASAASSAASSGSSAGVSSGAPSGSSATGSGSRPPVGAPLFASGSMPLIAFGASSPQIPDAPAAGGVPTSVLSMATSATASSGGSVQVSLAAAAEPAAAAPTLAPINDGTSLAMQNTPPAEGTSVSLYLAPTPVQAPVSTTTESTVASTDNKPLTMTSTPITLLTTTTTTTTTTTKENIPFVVHSDLDAPSDDQDFDPDATVQDQ